MSLLSNKTYQSLEYVTIEMMVFLFFSFYYHFATAPPFGCVYACLHCADI